MCKSGDEIMQFSDGVLKFLWRDNYHLEREAVTSELQFD